MTVEKILREFGKLATADERMEVCASIYFEMYGENIKDVMERRTVTDLKKENDALSGRIAGLLSSIHRKDEFVLTLKETLKKTRQEMLETRKARLTSMQVRTLWNLLPEDVKKEFKREFREDVICQGFRRALETKSERIRLLERMIDEHLAGGGK